MFLFVAFFIWNSPKLFESIYQSVIIITSCCNHNNNLLWTKSLRVIGRIIIRFIMALSGEILTSYKRINYYSSLVLNREESTPDWKLKSINLSTFDIFNDVEGIQILVKTENIKKNSLTFFSSPWFRRYVLLILDIHYTYIVLFK